MKSQRITISVIGASQTTPKMERIAHKVGKIVAEVDAVLVCGGLNGAMKAAAKGCKKAGGMTIGILPGKEKADANPYIDIALPTTIGYARNVIVSASAHIVIALAGSHGTSSEISYALVYNRPIIDLGGWNREGMIAVKDLKDAKKKIKELIREIKSRDK